jgi:GTPase
LGQPIPISAEHGEGLGDLYDALKEAIDRHRAREDGSPAPDAELIEVTPIDIEGEIVPDAPAQEAPETPIQIAIVGRPNVGKSTLVNSLLGAERMLTGPEAGITRDAIAIDWSFQGKKIRLVDTAGLRRRAKVAEKLEALSGADTRRAIRYAHVVLLVLDASDMLEKQDLAIASEVIEEGRALLLVVNKWDMVEDKSAALEKLRDRVEYSLPQVKGVPIVTVSALSGRNLDRMMAAALKIYGVWNARVPTSQLNRWLNDVIARHPPPLVGRQRIKPRYMTQVKTRPPTFALFAAKAPALPDAYHRYLVNGLRDAFALQGTPIRLFLRRPDNPFDEKRA